MIFHHKIDVHLKNELFFSFKFHRTLDLRFMCSLRRYLTQIIQL
jgi:hypothetical protein